MGKPILLSVDDDSDVLRAIERDLRSNTAPITESSAAALLRRLSTSFAS